LKILFLGINTSY